MTKLRTLLFAASLLLAQPMLAATHQARVQNKPPTKKVVASPANYTWCDSHVCEEPAHYVGKASYYGKGYWQGRKMANGQRFDYHKLTAACWFLPLGSFAQVVNLKNGKTVTVEITDRGPVHRLHRIIDLSQAAAEQLDFILDGTTTVVIHPIESTAAIVHSTLLELQKEADRVEILGIIVNGTDCAFKR